MRVDGAGGGDEPLAADDGGAGADHHIDIVLHVGVAGAADAADAPLTNADARLADAAGGIDDDDVGDDDIARVAHRSGLQQQPVTGGLAEAGQELVAAFLRVVLDLDDEARVAQPNPVTDRGAVDRGVCVGQDLVGVRVAVWHCAIVVAVLELAVRMAMRVAMTVGVRVVAHAPAPR